MNPGLTTSWQPAGGAAYVAAIHAERLYHSEIAPVANNTITQNIARPKITNILKTDALVVGACRAIAIDQDQAVQYTIVSVAA